MAQDVTELETEVSDTVGVMESATVLILGFENRLADAGVDPAKLAQLRDDLAARRTSLAEAVANNQPPF